LLRYVAEEKLPISFQLRLGEKNEKSNIGIRSRICILLDGYGC
jgi:hypothetical protein